MRFLVTGGSGFIGSAVIRKLINNTRYNVINVDKLTYAASKGALNVVENSSRYQFLKLDICDKVAIREVFEKYQPNIVMHLAAESHVDRSITGPIDFIQTNLFGTFNLLEASLEMWQKLPSKDKDKFLFHHISTDEVFGDLKKNAKPACENTKYSPSSPYSASKAGSDHLVNAWNRTYGLPIVLSNCSNNYGAFQNLEKFIPTVIICALKSKNIPIYGNGEQIRDWLFVEDHADALIKIAIQAKAGDRYNVGGNNEFRNIDVVYKILEILGTYKSDIGPTNNNLFDLITFVEDRPGHDTRYAIDSSLIETKLGWSAAYDFDSGLKTTVDWYVKNRAWWEAG